MDIRKGSLKLLSIVSNMPFFANICVNKTHLKMRSAQAPRSTWAIMKKFIYVCNVLTLRRSLLMI